MKKFRTVVCVVIVFLLGAVCGYGVSSIWIFDVQVPEGSVVPTVEVLPRVRENVSDDSAVPANTEPPLLTAPVTIPLSNLTSAQRSALSALGVSGESITITPKMAACAEGYLGRVRVEEIVKGAQPTATELIKVVPCL